MKFKNLCLLAVIFAATSLWANSASTIETISGQCGDSLYYSFNYSAGTLIFTGKGDMWRRDIWTNWPTSQNQEQIDSIVSAITTVAIPQGVTSIGAEALSRTAISNVTIPNSVTYISFEAFSKCNNLVSVTIPNSVTTMGAEAFSECGNLSSVTFPNSVTQVVYFDASREDPELQADLAELYNSYGYNIYENYGYLFSGTAITTPVYNNTIFAYCPSGCSSYTVPDGIKIIAGGAFEWNESLTSITLPEGLEEVGFSTFSGCPNLASINIPNSLRKVGIYSFYETQIQTPLYNDKLFVYHPSMGKSEGQQADTLSYTIPEGIEEICPQAFERSNISEVILPSSLKKINYSAFASCRNLTHIELPDSLIHIEAEAFSRTELSSVTLPRRVNYIGSGAFEDCGLRSVRVGAVVPPRMGYYKKQGPIDMSGNYIEEIIYPFDFIPNLVVSVPCNTASAYAAAIGWSKLVYGDEHFTYQFRVTASDETKGVVVISQEPSCQSNLAVIMAAPIDGYDFLGWSDGVNTNPRTIIVDHDINIVANFGNASGLNDISSEATSALFFRNGHIYIQRGERIYDLNGKEIQ